MRIAQMIETMSMGGAENLAVNIANKMADRGHDSHLVVIEKPGPLSARIQANVKCHYLDFRRASIRRPLPFLSSIMRGRQLINGVMTMNGIDLVQTHLPGANFWGLTLTHGHVCAVLPTVHNNEEFNYGNIDNTIQIRLRKMAYSRMTSDCAGLIAVSRAVRDSLGTDLGLSPAIQEKIAVVTNAVPMAPVVTAADRLAIREQLGVTNNEVFILAAGRFCEQKNFRDLIPVARYLRNYRVTFKIVVAGDGDLRQTLQQEINLAGLTERLVLPGNLDNLDHVMTAADIFVMTSLWEGLPLVLLEAMAASLPVVAYAIPGIVEVVQHESTGLTVATGDPEALARSMAVLLKDKDRRQEMGNRGRAIISAKYSFDTLADELIDIYTNAIAR